LRVWKETRGNGFRVAVCLLGKVKASELMPDGTPYWKGFGQLIYDKRSHRNERYRKIEKLDLKSRLSIYRRYKVHLGMSGKRLREAYYVAIKNEAF
jgi:hypothetical protein